MDFDVKIYVTKGQLKDMPRKIRDKVVPLAIERLANSTYYEMRSRVPVRTGVLRATIAKDVKKSSFSVGPTEDYAGFVILGTRAHVIRPRSSPVLHWQTDEGEDVFAMRVFHPGTRPNDFVTSTLDAISPTVIDVFDRVFTEEMDR